MTRRIANRLRRESCLSLNAFKLAELLDRHAAALELYAAQWTVNPEDCVQEAFIELAAQSTIPEHVAAWLFRVVRNKALNINRAAQRRTNHEQLAAMLVPSDVQHPAESLEMEESIRVAMESLAIEERELIVLRIWSGLTWEQIAELTETSTSTAHRRYVAALKQLKQILEPSCPKNLN